jgi:hypothetical protein
MCSLSQFKGSIVSKLDLHEVENLCVILEEIKDTLRDEDLTTTHANEKKNEENSKSSQSTKDNSYGKDEDNDEANISCIENFFILKD